MSILKKLAGQTAVYGLSSIVGRLLNYLLTPLYTGVFDPEEYGVVTELYAYVAFMVVLLTFGMETAYFRFVTKAKDPEKVFRNAFSLVLCVGVTVLVLMLCFSTEIAQLLRYPDQVRIIRWFALIVVVDAMISLFLARLRHENRSKKFALVNFTGIAVNIFFNLFFIWYCKQAYENNIAEGIENVPFLAMWYIPSWGIAYVFLANLISSLVKPLLLLKEIKQFRFEIDWKFVKPILLYALPMLLVGLSGIINETLDRILLKEIVLKQHDINEATRQVGVYGAVYKLSIIITLFVQAFRYAAEPFFFAQAEKEDGKKNYALVMNWFIIILSFVFLMVCLFLDVFKYFIPNSKYYEGLFVVPILLMANIFLGIYYNLSIWFKLSGHMMYGAYISGGGAFLTIIINIILIPYFGFAGAAWTTLIVYFTMSLVSFKVGQKYYPIKYQKRKGLLYLFSVVFLYFVYKLVHVDVIILDYFWRIVLIISFLLVVNKFEKTVSNI